MLKSFPIGAILVTAIYAYRTMEPILATLAVTMLIILVTIIVIKR